MINPCEEFVQDLRYRIKNNNGFCLYAEDRKSKKSKCTKWCNKDPEKCMCGMYVNVDEYMQMPAEYDLD